MISADDIAAFETESELAFREGRKFVERAARGIPTDRWTTAAGQRLVADCIRRQWVIMAMLTEAINEIEQDTIQRGDDAMGCFSKDGTRTS